MRGYIRDYRETDKSQDMVLRAFYSNFPYGMLPRMANAYLFVEMVEQAKTSKARIWGPDPKCAGKSVITERLMRARTWCFGPSIAIFRLVTDLEWRMPICL